MTRNGAAELIGTSPQIIALSQEIDRVARSDAKVLITGESGVGKELVARAVHTRSARAQRVFVPVNCAGLPETLLESELFGHVKGSFTGAYRDKPGKLEIADSGNVRELENVIERLVVTCRKEIVTVDDLPHEIRSRHDAAQRPRRERRRTIADDLYKRLVEDRESFWTAVYPLYMQREITRSNIRDLVDKGLQQARGNYKIVAQLFNMESSDYKKFLNFLRKHEC